MGVIEDWDEAAGKVGIRGIRTSYKGGATSPSKIHSNCRNQIILFFCNAIRSTPTPTRRYPTPIMMCEKLTLIIDPIPAMIAPNAIKSIERNDSICGVIIGCLTVGWAYC